MSWFKQSQLQNEENFSVSAATEKVVDPCIVILRCQNPTPPVEAEGMYESEEEEGMKNKEEGKKREEI